MKRRRASPPPVYYSHYLEFLHRIQSPECAIAWVGRMSTKVTHYGFTPWLKARNALDALVKGRVAPLGPPVDGKRRRQKELAVSSRYASDLLQLGDEALRWMAQMRDQSAALPESQQQVIERIKRRDDWQHNQLFYNGVGERERIGLDRVLEVMKECCRKAEQGVSQPVGLIARMTQLAYFAQFGTLIYDFSATWWAWSNGGVRILARHILAESEYTMLIDTLRARRPIIADYQLPQKPSAIPKFNPQFRYYHLIDATLKAMEFYENTLLDARKLVLDSLRVTCKILTDYKNSIPGLPDDLIWYLMGFIYGEDIPSNYKKALSLI